MKHSEYSGDNSLKWGIGLFVSLVLLVSSCALYVISDRNLYQPLNIYKTIELVGALYPENYHPESLVEKAQNAILNQLDRYSGLLEPRELNRVHEEFTGSYGGIGITVIGHEQGLMIMSVRDDGPAGQAGIRTGDIIIKADTTELSGLTAYQSTYLLRGPEETPLELTIIRGEPPDTIQFNLIRRQLPLIHIPYAGLTKNRSLYIKVIDFEAGVAGEFRAAFDSLYYDNRDSIGQVIIDLRGNPGGLLREACDIADLFLEAGTLIVGIKGRSIWRNEEIYSSGHDLTNGKPLAILVDRGSASASEIVSGALKYANRAILVGDTTFGKGLVQEFSGFGDGSGMRLTTSRYYFEGGIFLNNPNAEVIDSAAGIPPDYLCQFEEYESFPASLERTMLLRNFASDYQDSILQYAPFSKADYWVKRFKEYADENGYRYESNITSIAEFTHQFLMLSGYDKSYIEAIDRVREIARSDDADQFRIHSDYINRRLYQIADEIKFGIAASYRDAIVPYRQDIRLAESVLMEEKATD